MRICLWHDWVLAVPIQYTRWPRECALASIEYVFFFCGDFHHLFSSVVATTTSSRIQLCPGRSSQAKKATPPLAALSILLSLIFTSTFFPLTVSFGVGITGCFTFKEVCQKNWPPKMPLVNHSTQTSTIGFLHGSGGTMPGSAVKTCGWHPKSSS